MQRAFKGVWIPKEIWMDKNLNWVEKVLLVEIDSLDNGEGCWASNAYFAEFFSLSKSRVSFLISNLEKKGYITVDIKYKEGSKQVEKRIIKITSTYTRKRKGGIRENTYTPIRENAKENNTDINNIKDKCRKQVYDESSVYFRLANRLYERILENNPNHKKPNLQKWANDVRLMIERDKRTEKQITYLIDWCQNDNFWKANILSTGKLREKFDQLIMQVKSKAEKEKPQHPRVYVYDINAGED